MAENDVVMLLHHCLYYNINGLIILFINESLLCIETVAVPALTQY